MTQEAGHGGVETEENSNTNSNDNRTPAQVCASYDRGGGVGLRHSFAVYSTAELSWDWCRLQNDGELYAELVIAASAITDILPVYIAVGELSASDPVSLPWERSRHVTRHRDGSLPACLPWFLINAMLAGAHCMVGRNSVVESPLIILQRPWCVLELCCCDTRTVIAVYNFASLAEKFNPKIYRAATMLLSHEISTRAGGDCREYFTPLLSFKVPYGPWHANGYIFDSTAREVIEIYRAISTTSLRSHNPFWLCLISVCAICLNMAFSELIRTLHHDISNRDILAGLQITSSTSLFAAFNDEQSKGAVPKWDGRNTHTSWENSTRLRKSTSTDSFFHTQRKPPRLRGLSELDVTCTGDYGRSLVSLYQSILRRTGESIV
jgi:hypothetical protein